MYMTRVNAPNLFHSIPRRSRHNIGTAKMRGKLVLQAHWTNEIAFEEHKQVMIKLASRPRVDYIWKLSIKLKLLCPKNVIDYIEITSEFEYNWLNYNYFGNVIRLHSITFHMYRWWNFKHILGLLSAFANCISETIIPNNYLLMCLKGFIIICVKLGNDCSLRCNWLYVPNQVLKGEDLTCDFMVFRLLSRSCRNLL